MAHYDPNYRDNNQSPEWEIPEASLDFPEDDETPYVYLPHQCDRWRIGEVDDVKALIADLEALITNAP